MKKTFKCSLSSRSINDVRRQLYDYKSTLREKTELLSNRVAEYIRQSAEAGFASAIADDRLTTGPKSAEVKVTVDGKGTIQVVIANGKDAVWCEFGAGVYHNGGVGSSPHPKGAENGFTIGTYGKGKGAQTVWGYMDENGALCLTHGTPASMPMYRALQSAMEHIVEMAKEVFS